MTETAEEPYVRQPVDIHLWFGLTYSNYLVLPRTVLQSAPLDWQHRFTAVLDELYGMMGEGMKDKVSANYEVRVLARSQERIDVYPTCETCEGKGTVKADDGSVYADTGEPADIDCPDCNGNGILYDEGPEDTRYETAEEVGLIDDPIPHYNRGRTELDFDTGEELRYCNLCKGRHIWLASCPKAVASAS